MTGIDRQTLLPALQALRGYQGETVNEADFPEAAVLVPLIAKGDAVSVLLTKRAAHLNLHAGESAFPGGKCDPGDPSLMATALREAQEEINLDPDGFEWWFTLDQRVTRTDIKVTPFVGFIPPDQPLAPNPDEIDEVFTVPLEHFMDQRNLRAVELDYHGGFIRSACFSYAGHDIWGMTAWTIVDLVNTAFDLTLDI